jgi:hypothetical protein
MDDFFRKRTGTGCLVVGIVVLACLGSAFFAFDRVCVAALDWRLPIYPGAHIVTQRHNFVTANGLGQTVTTLYAPANYLEVNRWYAVTISSRTKDYNKSEVYGAYYNLTRGTTWSVTVAEDGVGTQVFLFANCAN